MSAELQGASIFFGFPSSLPMVCKPSRCVSESSPEPMCPDSPPPLLTPTPPSSPRISPTLPGRREVKAPSGAEVIDFDGRDDRLPVFYRVNSHPQVSHVPGVRNVYIYIQDTDEHATRKYLQFVKDLVLPDGTQSAVAAAGTAPIPFSSRSSLTSSA